MIIETNPRKETNQRYESFNERFTKGELKFRNGHRGVFYHITRGDDKFCYGRSYFCHKDKSDIKYIRCLDFEIEKQFSINDEWEQFNENEIKSKEDGF